MADKKHKNENIEYNELKKAIAEQQLKPLYVLWGEESYLKGYYFKEMTKILIPAGTEEFNHKYFEGKNVDLNELSAAIDALPVFSEHTLIEVRDFDFYKAGEETRDRLDAILKDIPDYCCIVFFFSDPEFKPLGTTKIHHTVKKVGSSVEFKVQEHSDLIAWLNRRFKALGHTIDRAEAQYMLFYCGESMTTLITELEKAAAYSKTDRITKEDIDAVCTPVITAQIFDMTDAISKRDFNRSAKIMGDLLQMKEPPIKILAVIGKQLRQLYYARLCIEHGKNRAYLMELCDIKKEYPAKLLMENAGRLSLRWCESAVRLSADTDYMMKRDSMDDEELLKLMLVKLASI